MIDSNVVEYFKNIVEPIGDYCISGIDGTKHKVDVVILPFNFEGYTYKPKFCVQQLSDAFKEIAEDSGIQVHGLLGTDFLIENKWIIDFKELIYTVKNSPRYTLGCCAFLGILLVRCFI